MQRNHRGYRNGLTAAGVVWLMFCGCGPDNAVKSTADGDAEAGGEVDSSPEPFDLEKEWPGVFFVGLLPGGGGGDSKSVMEFREDHTLDAYQLKCDGVRTDGIIYDWRVGETGVVEIVIPEGTATDRPVGEVYEQVFVENKDCGPHRTVRYTGLEQVLAGGNYCPKDILEDIEGFKTCDFVPCDERAIRCAAEAEAAEGE